MENPDYLKFFVWLNLASEVEYSFDSAQKFDITMTADQYQVSYFVKRSGKEQVVVAKIDQQIMTGQINGNPLDDLLNKMNNEYVPKLHGENDWPDGVKKEFQANLNKFMATLTEESATSKGRTQLYIPEEHISDVDTAVRDKDLL